MKKNDRNDLIERYLADALSTTEREEVERLLLSDPEFHTELELHRALHQHLGDPGELRLRAALDDIMNPSVPENAATPANSSTASEKQHWFRLAILLALLLLVVLVGWYGWNRFNPKTEPIQTRPNNVAPLLPDSAPTNPVPPASVPDLPKINQPEQPIAMADPADFTPNPALDARIGGVRGNNEVELVLSSPAPDAAFLLKKGRVDLKIQGEIYADSLSATQALRLFIYSNRPGDWETKHSLFDLPIPAEPKGQGQYRVDFSRQLSLKPGLYYIVAGQQRVPETGSGYQTLWVGKFSVKAKK